MPRGWSYDTLLPPHMMLQLIITDMSPWTAQTKYCHLVHQPTAELKPMTGVGDLPLDTTATPDTHAMTIGTDLGSVALDPDPITTAIGVVATGTLAEVTPDHSTDLPIAISHVTEAPVPTATVTIHLTTDLHLIGTLPETTADLNIGPGNNITNQTEDLHPLHRLHHGDIRTKDTNKQSPYMQGSITKH